MVSSRFREQNVKIDEKSQISFSDFCLLNDNVKLKNTGIVYKKNGKIIFYVSLEVQETLSGEAFIFTINENYRPIGYYVILPARNQTSPYTEKGTLWIFGTSGIGKLYGNFSSKEILFISGEYSI